MVSFFFVLFELGFCGMVFWLDANDVLLEAMGGFLAAFFELFFGRPAAKFLRDSFWNLPGVSGNRSPGCFALLLGFFFELYFLSLQQISVFWSSNFLPSL